MSLADHAATLEEWADRFAEHGKAELVQMLREGSEACYVVEFSGSESERQRAADRLSELSRKWDGIAAELLAL